VAEMRTQAEQFHATFVDDEAVQVDISKRPFSVRTKQHGTLQTHALVIATGARS